MFDIQRFAEDDKPIPPELAGISEEVARDIIGQANQPATVEKSADNPVDADDPNDVKVSYSRFKETLDQKNDIERQLAAYRERFGDINAQPQPQQPQSQPQLQPQYQTPQQQNNQPQQGYSQAQQQQPQAPLVQNLTADLIKNFEDAINYGAKQLSGFSDEQIEELDYLDDDDPRIKQWKFAKRIAENAVYNNYISEQVAQQQELQRRALMQNQSISAFNDYVARQQADENFNAVRQFAINDFYNSLSDFDKMAISDAQYRIANKTAFPTDYMAVRDFFTRAKAEYDSRHSIAPLKNNPQFPRTDKVNGIPGSGGGVTEAALAEMVKTVPWAQIPQEYKDIMMRG